MTIQEIGGKLQNGFHDSYIHSIELDYMREVAKFVIEVDLTSPDFDVEVESRKGRLEISGLLYFTIGPPLGQRFEAEYMPGESPLWVTADSSDFSSLNDISSLPSSLPNGSFQHWFFVSSLNSYIYIYSWHGCYMEMGYCYEVMTKWGEITPSFPSLHLRGPRRSCSDGQIVANKLAFIVVSAICLAPV